MIAVVTGKGGAGTTTVAAATALAAAAAGLRVVLAGLGEPGAVARVVGWDRRGAVRLERLEGAAPGEALVWDVGRGPLAAGGEEGLLRQVLLAIGLGRLEPEEAGVLPGLGDLDRLAEFARIATEDRFDLVVLDAGPMAEGLRLLGWLDLVAATAGDHPGRSALEALAEALSDPYRALAWIVMTGEPTALDFARDAAGRLALLRLHLRGVVVNRLFVPSVTSGYLSAWAGAQSRVLSEARAVFRDLPITPLWLQPEEVVGVPALLRLAEDLFGGRDVRELVRAETRGGGAGGAGTREGAARGTDGSAAREGRGGPSRARGEAGREAAGQGPSRAEWPARFLDPGELVALRRGPKVALVTPRYRGLLSLPPGAFGRARWDEDRLVIE